MGFGGPNKAMGVDGVVAERYVLLRPLGGGGGGHVWLAEDLRRDRRLVAFKCVVADARGCDWALQAESLEQEFRVLAKLRHPNLMRVYDIGVLPGGGRFMTEEYVDGETLEELVGRFPPEQVEVLCAQLLQALDHLERHSVVHRDIKPGNVMVRWRLSRDGAGLIPEVKVLDFGLALSVRGDVVEGAEFQGGTGAYMAPERLLGHEADTVSELYSLAATVYHVVTGRPPQANRVKSPQALIGLAPPSFDDFPDEVSTGARGVLRRMLSVSRSARYPDAREALEDLVFRSAGRLSDAQLHIFQGMDEGGALVGRHELVEGLLARHIDGECGRWLLVGPVGLGKRRLARELEIHIQLQGRATYRVEVSPGGAPYLVPMQLAEMLSPVERGQRASPPTLSVPQEARRSIFSVLNRGIEPMLLKKLRSAVDAQAAAVIFIEDLDLADRWSLQLLATWLQAPHPISVVATASHVPAELTEVFERLTVRPLEASEVERYLRDLFGVIKIEPHVLAKLVEVSDGVPARLRAVCARLLERGLVRRRSGDVWQVMDVPNEVVQGERAFEPHLEDFSPEGRWVVEALALLERVVEKPLIQRLIARFHAAPPSLVHVTRLLRELERGGCLYLERQRGEVVVRPPGARSRKLIKARLKPPRRRALHGAIGEVLAEHWRSSGGAEAREVAYHLQRSETRELARTFEMIAAVDALKVGAIDRAREHFQWSLRARLRGAERAYARLCEGLLAMRQGDVEEANSAFVEASHFGGEGYVGLLATVQRARLAIQRHGMKLVKECLATLRRRWPEALGSYLVQRLVATEARARWAFDEATVACERAIEVARVGGWRAGVYEGRLDMALSLMEMGQLAEAKPLMASLLSDNALEQMPRSAGQLRIFWGWLCFLEGRLDEAYTAGQEGHRLLGAAGDVRLHLEALILLVSVDFERRSIEDMLRHVRLATTLIKRVQAPGLRLVISGLHQLACVVEGMDGEEALKTLRSLLDHADARPIDRVRLHLTISGACWHLERLREGRAHVSHVLEILSKTPTQRHLLTPYAERMWSHLSATPS